MSRPERASLGILAATVRAPFTLPLIVPALFTTRVLSSGEFMPAVYCTATPEAAETLPPELTVTTLSFPADTQIPAPLSPEPPVTVPLTVTSIVPLLSVPASLCANMPIESLPDAWMVLPASRLTVTLPLLPSDERFPLEPIKALVALPPKPPPPPIDCASTPKA